MQIVDVLLALLFLSSTVIFIRIFSHKKAFHSFILLSSAALSTLFFEHLFQGSVYAVRTLYPWILPLLFVIGPAYYMSSCKSRVSPAKALIHFIPALIILSVLLTHWALNAVEFHSYIRMAVTGEFAESALVWIITDDVLILMYPLHGGSYVFFSLLKYIEKKSYSNYYITITLLLSVYAFWEYLNVLFYDFSVTGLTASELRLVSIIGAFGLIAYYLYYNKTIMFESNSLDVLETNIPVGAEVTPNTPVFEQYQPVFTPSNFALFERISAYLKEIVYSPESVFYDPLESKESIIEKSPFRMREWELYFSFKKQTFSEIKQELRINRALFLINEGYLNNNTIEDLTQAIGYKSRSHFYKTFKKVMGVSFSKFQKSTFIRPTISNKSKNPS